MGFPPLKKNTTIHSDILISMTKTSLKEKAIVLRKQGYTYTYILAEVPVSKSTLSHWLRNIPFRPNKKMRERIGNARVQAGITKNKQKLESIKKAKHLAEKEVGTISKRDLFMLGLGLYMGEGSKSHSIVRIINADANIIKLSMKWFQEIFGLGEENFSLRIHLYPENDMQKCLEYWSNETDIPISNFQKTQIDRRKKKVSKRGKLPFGTAHLTVKKAGMSKFGMPFSRKILALIDQVNTMV